MINWKRPFWWLILASIAVCVVLLVTWGMPLYHGRVEQLLREQIVFLKEQAMLREDVGFQKGLGVGLAQGFCTYAGLEYGRPQTDRIALALVTWPEVLRDHPLPQSCAELHTFLMAGQKP